MKSLIVGCGYIGEAVARLWDRPDVTFTSLKKAPFANRVIVINPQTLPLLAEITPHYDLILLCVAAKEYRETYLLTAQTLKSALSPHTHLIYTSSTSVYGDHQGKWVTEDSSAKIDSDPSAILYETEQTILSTANSCVLRLGQIVGEGRSITGYLAKRLGQPLTGAGDSYVNISLQKTIVRAIDFVKKRQMTGLFNLCEDFHPYRRELYDAICKREGWPLFAWLPPSFQRGNKRVCSNRLAKRGFSFKSFTLSDL